MTAMRRDMYVQHLRSSTFNRLMMMNQLCDRYTISRESTTDCRGIWHGAWHQPSTWHPQITVVLASGPGGEGFSAHISSSSTGRRLNEGTSAQLRVPVSSSWSACQRQQGGFLGHSHQRQCRTEDGHPPRGGSRAGGAGRGLGGSDPAGPYRIL